MSVAASIGAAMRCDCVDECAQVFKSFRAMPSADVETRLTHAAICCSVSVEQNLRDGNKMKLPVHGVKALGVTALALSVVGSPSPAASAVDGPKVSWNASVWGPPRPVTSGLDEVSKVVEAETGGKFTIKVHYGEALSKGIDNLDNIKLGAFEVALICTGYHPGKHPSINVLDLPGLPLRDPKVYQVVHEKVYQHPAVAAEFKRWNALLFMSVLQPQSELMGAGSPPTKMDDFKGMRVRALGGTGDALRNLGAVPTSVPAPEVYNGLERGVFTAASFPFTYAYSAYKLHEVSKWYTINLSPGANSCPLVINLSSYNELPQQYKDLLTAAKGKGYARLVSEYTAADEKNLAEWKKKGLTEIRYSDEELAKFSAVGAKPVWDKWVADAASKGAPAQELLDLVLREAKAAGAAAPASK
jgi:TRAP-type C4-dicarboxylate transport system substrate-binding protein